MVQMLFENVKHYVYNKCSGLNLLNVSRNKKVNKTCKYLLQFNVFGVETFPQAAMSFFLLTELPFLACL